MPILLLALTLFALQDEPAALIEKLRSENPEVRDAATKKLRELGASARLALEKAARDPDAELAARATRLLRILSLQVDLTSNLQKAMPDIADRLAAGEGRAWTAAFLEAAALDEKEDRKQHAVLREDLVPLVARAIASANTSEDKIKACWLASKWRLHSALPEMQKLLGDPDQEVRRLVLVWMVMLIGRESAPHAAKCLKDEIDDVRRHAANHLAFIGTRAQSGDLRAALKDGDQRVRLNAARALGKLGDRTAVDTILPLMKTEFRADAVIALGELGSTQHAGMIAALLDEEGARWCALVALDALDARDRAESIAKYLEAGPGTPGHAAMVLGNWKARAYADRIGALVKNNEVGAYNLAVLALGRMGDPRQAKVLVPILKGSDVFMRAGAAESLELLDAREHAGDVATLLQDTDSYARWSGALSLGKLAARLPEAERKMWIDSLKTLEKDPAEVVRFGAAISLIRLGALGRVESRDLVGKLDSTTFDYWSEVAFQCVLALTHAHEGAGYGKLLREIELKRAIDAPESLTTALADAGLKLVPWNDLMLNGRMGPGRVIRPLDLLQSLVVPAWGFILEKDELRLVTREEALGHWLKRLERN